MRTNLGRTYLSHTPVYITPEQAMAISEMGEIEAALSLICRTAVVKATGVGYKEGNTTVPPCPECKGKNVALETGGMIYCDDCKINYRVERRFISL